MLLLFYFERLVGGIKFDVIMMDLATCQRKKTVRCQNTLRFYKLRINITIYNQSDSAVD